MADFQVILEQAMFDDKEVHVTTKDRGVITGMYTGFDEYDTDPERLGYYLSIDPHFYDTVFLDEIVSIEPVIEFARKAM